MTNPRAPAWLHAPLADPAEVERRRTLLPHSPAAPLQDLVAELRARHGAVPDPDPLDGGAAAPILLLLETPGPAIGRSLFVSADNPTGTGRNLRRFWTEAGLARTDRLIWNTVPWIIHAGGRNRAPRAAELRAGIAELPALFRLIAPRLVILAGRSAAGAESQVPSGLPVLTMPHPSPTIVCTSPAIASRIRATLAEAAAIVAAAAPDSARSGPAPPPGR